MNRQYEALLRQERRLAHARLLYTFSQPYERQTRAAQMEKEKARFDRLWAALSLEQLREFGAYRERHTP